MVGIGVGVGGGGGIFKWQKPKGSGWVPHGPQTQQVVIPAMIIPPEMRAYATTRAQCRSRRAADREAVVGTVLRDRDDL